MEKRSPASNDSGIAKASTTAKIRPKPDRKKPNEKTVLVPSKVNINLDVERTDKHVPSVLQHQPVERAAAVPVSKHRAAMPHSDLQVLRALLRALQPLPRGGKHLLEQGHRPVTHENYSQPPPLPPMPVFEPQYGHVRDHSPPVRISKSDTFVMLS